MMKINNYFPLFFFKHLSISILLVFLKMEYRTFLGVSPPIEQAIDMQTAQQSSVSCSRQDMNAYFYSAPRMRVSEKLLQNRLRKLEL